MSRSASASEVTSPVVSVEPRTVSAVALTESIAMAMATAMDRRLRMNMDSRR